MKRLRLTFLCLSVVFLCYWHPVHHGYCSEQNKPDPQNQPQITQNITEQKGESKKTNDEVISVDPPAPHTPEHNTNTETGSDELPSQETGLQEEHEKDPQVDETTSESVLTSEASASELNSDQTAPESSVPPKKQNTDLSPVLTETSSQPSPVSESLSSSTPALPESAPCSVADGVCSSTSITAISATAACDLGDSPSYGMDLTSSLPSVLENTSTPGTGKGTKAGLDRAKGTNESSMLKDKNVHVTTESDPSVSSKDPEDIPTFDEWKKIMMEVENEKSQTTHTSCNGGSSSVKKVQKTTNYASVECGAKILSSNPEAKSTSAILMENMDVYMLNPCSNKIWFVIELCQPIQVKQLDIANFELFSSTPKDFLVSISDRYPTNKWAKLGTFHARDERTVQSFPLDEHLYAKYVKMFTKYIKVELLSHFGSEHFCPLSLIRVFGTSMMEEYELNSEPSERLNIEDEDYDYLPGCLPSDDKSSKNLIGSAKDVILNMVNNIAANVLGGNPEDAAGNYSSVNPNLTETSEAPETVSQTPSYVILETIEEEQLDLKMITETTSITQDTRDADQTVPVPTASFTETPSSLSVSSSESIISGSIISESLTPESLAPALPDEEQIITLLPSEEEDEENQGQTSSSAPQEEEQEVKTELDQQFSGVQEMMCCKQVCDSCSCVVSFKEYLLQNCLPPLPVLNKKNKKRMKTTEEDLQKSQSSSDSQQTLTTVLITTTTSAFFISTVETSVLEDSSTRVLSPPFLKSEKKPEAGSLDLEPSMTSALPKPTSIDTLISKATQTVDFLDPSVIETPQPSVPVREKTREKPAEIKKTTLLTAHPESTPVLNTKTDEVHHDQKPQPEEKSSPEKDETVTSVDETLPPLSSQPTKTKTTVNTGTLTASPVTEPLEGTLVIAEPKAEDLLEEAVLGESSTNGQSGQPSSSDFYAEMPSTTDTPISGSNQKESVFMRLNNRIKALEVNMSLSGRYLEQLSQRYRKQMEEMQKAFNKTIIKLQNTSRIAEEQDQKQTESIQVLQGQLENVTELVLNLSVRVSQLQREVSDRYSYLLLCLVLCLLLGLAVCINFCHLSAETSSPEPDSPVPKAYTYCCPDSSLGYEDVNLKRRASYPLTQSSLQIPAEGPNPAYNLETHINTTGNKKKKRCKMKSNPKPETITPTILSVSSLPNGRPQCLLPAQVSDCKISTCVPGPSHFSFREAQSEGSSEASSQSDESLFCGISTCNRLCDQQPPQKSRSEKRAFKRRRSKPACEEVQQLLQPGRSSGPAAAQPGATVQGFIRSTSELSTGRVEVTTIT